jgi:hypothetical protein
MSYTHLAWSIGHIVVLLSTIWNTLGILFLQSRPKAYSLAYGGQSAFSFFNHLSCLLFHMQNDSSSIFTNTYLVFDFFLWLSGAILSWSIVVYKSLGTPSLSKAYLQRAAMDENVQYLVVALYWFFSKPIFG